jgi:membrane associated rhomboid family serine protease
VAADDDGVGFCGTQELKLKPEETEHVGYAAHVGGAVIGAAASVAFRRGLLRGL